MLISLTVIGVARASTPAAPITVCSDKNGSFNYAMCLGVAGGTNIEVGNSFQFAAWEERRISNVWYRVPASIAISMHP